MHADAILNMVEDSLCGCYFCIGVIVSEYDSTVRYMINQPSKGVWVKVPNSYKEKIDKEIPVPSFLVDPSHGKSMLYYPLWLIQSLRDVDEPNYMITESIRNGGIL